MASNDNPKPGSENDPLSFSVMPQTGDTNYVEHEPSEAHSLGAQVAPVEAEGEAQAQDATPMASPHSRKGFYIILSLILLIGLGVSAYFMVGPDLFGRNEAIATRLPKIFLQQHFGTETCMDQETCGDAADPDKDGLQNFDELKEQTIPTNPDSDKDGLADGDEVYIYLTDPANKYTDDRPVAVQNDYNDGSQIKNGYDPLTPNIKMTDTRKEQINKETAKFKLHEPTITTLAKPSAPAPKNVTVSIAAGKFDAAEATIAVNDTVTWVNRDAAAHQIASDPHPSHIALPELESGSLATNQTYDFKFTKAGTYTYHDHLNPTIKGTVIVQ
jgi:plastocyanin